MIVHFWQQEQGCDGVDETLTLITDDLDYAKEIIQSLADYDQKSYIFYVHEAMRWGIIQDDPELPEDERRAVTYTEEIVPGFYIAPKTKEVQ